MKIRNIKMRYQVASFVYLSLISIGTIVAGTTTADLKQPIMNQDLPSSVSLP
jgi:hypothetical protein